MQLALALLVVLVGCTTKQIEPARPRAELVTPRVGVGAPIAIATAWEGRCVTRETFESDCHDSILGSTCEQHHVDREGPCKLVPYTVAHRCAPTCTTAGGALTAPTLGRRRIVTTLHPASGKRVVFEHEVDVVDPERIQIECAVDDEQLDLAVPCDDPQARAFVVRAVAGGSEYSVHVIQIGGSWLGPARVVDDPKARPRDAHPDDAIEGRPPPAGKLAVFSIAAAAATGSVTIRVGTQTATLTVAR